MQSKKVLADVGIVEALAGSPENLDLQLQRQFVLFGLLAEYGAEGRIVFKQLQQLAFMVTRLGALDNLFYRLAAVVFVNERYP